MIVEGLTEPEIQALLVACEMTDVVADGLADRIGHERKQCARDTAREKLIVTLGTRPEGMGRLECLR
jgi:hypothetical protein